MRLFVWIAVAALVSCASAQNASPTQMSSSAAASSSGGNSSSVASGNSTASNSTSASGNSTSGPPPITGTVGEIKTGGLAGTASAPMPVGTAAGPDDTHFVSAAQQVMGSVAFPLAAAARGCSSKCAGAFVRTAS
ncbi:uncharacterized protein MJAP1_002967 [Malassezia japonica]|uniref:Uncharacterized protein n=1 Tax=Malassezia japonica TaxID=223818 RepID=A0AAF0EZP8_9BASI|nr:uncharacterized protein MJAP1_002967 [Malassezia japonica]WFD39985.1 hypothetical protein MJAP1_002967 [Malassezia japonica]